MLRVYREISKKTLLCATSLLCSAQTTLPAGSVIETKSQSHLQSIIDSGAPVAVKFYRPSCPACKSFGPVFAQAAAEAPHVTFVAVDISEGENNALGHHHNVQRIPTVVHFKNGHEIARKTGSHSKEEIKKVHAQ